MNIYIYIQLKNLKLLDRRNPHHNLIILLSVWFVSLGQSVFFIDSFVSLGQSVFVDNSYKIAPTTQATRYNPLGVLTFMLKVFITLEELL